MASSDAAYAARVKRGGRPAEVLAYLIRRDLGLTVDPKDLRRFLLTHWAEVQILSHAIHEHPTGD